MQHPKGPKGRNVTGPCLTIIKLSTKLWIRDRKHPTASQLLVRGIRQRGGSNTQVSKQGNLERAGGKARVAEMIAAHGANNSVVACQCEPIAPGSVCCQAESCIRSTSARSFD